MKNAYLITVHVINLLLLGTIGFLGIGLFVNISEPDGIPTFNPIDIGILIFLLLMWVVNYWYQFKNRKWIVLLSASLIFIVAASIIILVIMPLLFNFFYF
ncbi:hypothetical protein [Oceanobacillus picturae]|uniref:hypothetical protein n=1 Tax=Oceanobacillus picturae TaxID=171693 RepID=UPI003635613E